MDKSHMDINQRYFNMLNMFVTEGAIYYLHYTLIHFGYPDKPMHFAVSTSNLKIGATRAFFNPCTSQLRNDNSKGVFTFNLNEGIRSNDKKYKTTYVLLSLSRCVKLVDFTKTDYCIYKGRMKVETLSLYRKAKKEFIRSQHIHRGKK